MDHGAARDIPGKAAVITHRVHGITIPDMRRQSPNPLLGGEGLADRRIIQARFGNKSGLPSCQFYFARESIAVTVLKRKTPGGTNAEGLDRDSLAKPVLGREAEGTRPSAWMTCVESSRQVPDRAIQGRNRNGRQGTTRTSASDG